jgi:uncharacterized RDD family membrane protein YckC
MSDSPGTLRIVTPEGIVFHYASLAGPVLRSLAWLIDAGCVFGLSGAAGAGLKGLGMLDADAARALTIVLYAVFSVGYSMALEWYWRGQTIGKRTMGLRVIDAAGLHLRPFQVVMRNLMRYVDALPAFYLVGGIACLLNAKLQRLGDIAAHTVVIRVSKAVQPNLDKIGRSKYNSLLEYPALCLRLRQKTSTEAAAAAFGALLRREEFDSQARSELFKDLLAYFETLVQFPDEIREQISPEQVVRNVVEVLYSR